MFNAIILDTFDEVAPILETFAETNNLLLEKYDHEAPIWRFSFKHPIDGVGSILVSVNKKGEISVSGSWWIDEYDNGIRRLRVSESVVTIKIDLSNTMKTVLATLLKWSPQSLTEHKGYKESWHQYFTRRQFDQINDKYPALQQQS
jgi:hypothetical protein